MTKKHVPVWDFIGNQAHATLNGQPQFMPFEDESFVTINAIDGISIYRERSY